MSGMKDEGSTRTPISVGEFLSSAGQPGLLSRASGAALAFALGLWAVDIFFLVLINQVAAGEPMQVPKCAVQEMIPVFAILGMLLFISSPILHLISGRLGGSSRSRRIQVERVAIGALLRAPRAGITRDTALESVRIRCKALRGAKGEAYVCWCEDFPFTSSDFKAFECQDFAATDFLVVNGRLLVFFSNEGKRAWMARVEKGRSGD